MNKVGRPSKTQALVAVEPVTSPPASPEVSVADLQVISTSELFKTIGRIETAHFFETVSSRVLIDSYLKAKALFNEIKELPYVDATGKTKHVSSLSEFCDVFLRVSQRRCQQLVNDEALLGSELYDQAEQLGFKARDYQALKALPDDEQAIVKQAIESGSRDAALDALHELALRNAELKRRAAEDELRAAAKDKIIEKDSKKLRAIEEEAEARRLAPLPEQEAMQLDELRDVSLAAQDAIQRLLITVTTVMNDPKSDAAELAARHSLDYVVQRLADVCGECGVAVDVLGERVEPGWMRPITEAVEQAKKLLRSKA